MKFRAVTLVVLLACLASGVSFAAATNPLQPLPEHSFSAQIITQFIERFHKLFRCIDIKHISMPCQMCGFGYKFSGDSFYWGFTGRIDVGYDTDRSYHGAHQADPSISEENV